MFAISISVDIKDMSKCFDTALEAELVSSIWSLTECSVNMAIIFFNVVLLKLGIAFLKFFNLFSGKDFTAINFNG